MTMTSEEMREATKKMRFEDSVESNRNWTDSEREKLKSLFNNGYGITEIALELERTERAVNQELYHQDCYPRKKRTYRRKEKVTGCLCSQCGVRDECREE